MRGPAGAVSGDAPSTRILRPGERWIPRDGLTPDQLRAFAHQTLAPVTIPALGGLPDNEVITRAYPETGIYPLAVARVETPYRLWNLVRQWAVMQGGYRFNYPGDCGSLQYPAAAGPSHLRNREEPVTRVSWLDAVVWCNALSELTGRDPVYRVPDTGEPLRDASTFRVAMYRPYAYPNTGRYANRPLDTAAILTLRTETSLNGFRLPSLAEVEALHTPSTDPAQGWFAVNADGRTHPVGTRAATPSGLYDLDGNVQEMTYGGNHLFGQMRAGNHFADPPGHRHHPMTAKELPAVGRSYLGFRVVARPVESEPHPQETSP